METNNTQGSSLPAGEDTGGTSPVTAQATAGHSGTAQPEKQTPPAYGVLIRLGLILLLVGLIGFSVYQLYRHMTRGLNTLRTQEVTDVSYATLELYLFRDEAVLTAPGGGNVFAYRVQDGEKVAAGTLLWDGYTTFDSQQAATLQAQLNLYGERLARLDGFFSQGTAALTDAKSAKDRIESDYRGVLASVSGGDLRAMAGYSEQMLAAMDRYSMLIGSGGGAAVQRETLTAAREALLQGLTAAGSLQTDQAGWFYYDTDGYESVFSYSDVMTVTPADFRRMTGASAETAAFGTGGKMVYSAEWYAVCSVSLTEAACFTVGGSYTMLCGDSAGCEIPMTCVRVDADAEGALLVFRSMAMPDGFAFERRMTVQTAYASVGGYRIPESAVVTETSPTTGEQVSGVYVLEGNVVAFRRVWVRESRDGYLIAYTEAEAKAILATMDEDRQTAIGEDGWSFLSLNDNIIVGGSGLYDGKVIG